MITPNKVVALEGSALGMASVILDRGPQPTDLLVLHRSVSSEFESIDHFLLTLDVLYVLGRIDVDFRTRTVRFYAL